MPRKPRPQQDRVSCTRCGRRRMPRYMLDGVCPVCRRDDSPQGLSYVPQLAAKPSPSLGTGHVPKLDSRGRHTLWPRYLAESLSWVQPL